MPNRGAINRAALNHPAGSYFIQASTDWSSAGVVTLIQNTKRDRKAFGEIFASTNKTEKYAGHVIHGAEIDSENTARWDFNANVQYAIKTNWAAGGGNWEVTADPKNSATINATASAVWSPLQWTAKQATAQWNTETTGGVGTPNFRLTRVQFTGTLNGPVWNGKSLSSFPLAGEPDVRRAGTANWEGELEDWRLSPTLTTDVGVEESGGMYLYPESGHFTGTADVASRIIPMVGGAFTTNIKGVRIQPIAITNTPGSGICQINSVRKRQAKTELLGGGSPIALNAIITINAFPINSSAKILTVEDLSLITRGARFNKEFATVVTTEQTDITVPVDDRTASYLWLKRVAKSVWSQENFTVEFKGVVIVPANIEMLNTVKLAPTIKRTRLIKGEFVADGSQLTMPAVLSKELAPPDRRFLVTRINRQFAVKAITQEFKVAA